MSLTFSDGPLSGHPPQTVNYRIEGPAHKLLMRPFPRQVRAAFGGQFVVDTTRAVLLYKTGLPPRVYVPTDDIRADLLTATDHHTYCPFKGTASYWTVTAGGRQAEGAVWAYPEPNAEEWAGSGLRRLLLEGHGRVVRNEDELVELGGLPDPYHRVRRAPFLPRHVRVLLEDDQVLAETSAPLLLSETGLPNRFYIPAQDVRQDLLEPSDTHTVCP